MLNEVKLEGFVPKNVKVKFTQSGLGVTNFSVSVSRKNKETGKYINEYMSCVLFGEPRDDLEGARVIVEGRLQVESRETSEGKRTYYSVIVNDIEIVQAGKSTPVDDSEEPFN